MLSHSVQIELWEVTWLGVALLFTDDAERRLEAYLHGDLKEGVRL